MFPKSLSDQLVGTALVPTKQLFPQINTYFTYGMMRRRRKSRGGKEEEEKEEDVFIYCIPMLVFYID